MPRPRLGAEPMTPAERQAKRREQFRQMREALERVAASKTIKEPRQVAEAALSEISP